jgi:hypothetical protein
MRAIRSVILSVLVLATAAACAPENKPSHPANTLAGPAVSDSAATAAATTDAPAATTTAAVSAADTQAAATQVNPAPPADPSATQPPPPVVKQTIADTPPPVVAPPPPPTDYGPDPKMGCIVPSEETVWIHVGAAHNVLTFTAKVADCKSHMHIAVVDNSPKWIWVKEESFTMTTDNAQLLLAAATKLRPYLHTAMAAIGGLGATGFGVEALLGAAGSETGIGVLAAIQAGVGVAMEGNFAFEQLVRRQIEIEMKKIAPILLDEKSRPSEAQTTIHLHGFINELAPTARLQLKDLISDLKRMSAHKGIFNF